MKVEIIKRPVTLSCGFFYKGQPIILVDSRLPRKERISIIATIKAKMEASKKDH